MKIESLGHIVLKVSNLNVSRDFYHELLGLPISAESKDWGMIFFTLGSHHDFAIIETGSEAERNFEGVGVDHFAFKISGDLDDLYVAKNELESAGVKIDPVNHHVSFSLYFNDPDGNKLDVYVDTASDWRTNPSLITTEATELTFVNDT